MARPLEVDRRLVEIKDGFEGKIEVVEYRLDLLIAVEGKERLKRRESRFLEQDRSMMTVEERRRWR